MNKQNRIPDINHANNLGGSRLAFIGAGVMAEAMVAGLLRGAIVRSEQIVASHPRPDRRAELAERYKIRAVEQNVEAVLETQSTKSSIVVLCVKPQRAAKVMDELKSSITEN